MYKLPRDCLFKEGCLPKGRRWEPWRWRQWGRGGWWRPWTRPRPHRPGTSVHGEQCCQLFAQLFGQSTLIKNKINFSSYIRNSEGSCAKSYMTNDLLIYGENICAFPHILGSPSSYITLHPIPTGFPYIWGKVCFLFYQCRRKIRQLRKKMRSPSSFHFWRSLGPKNTIFVCVWVGKFLGLP